ncbi:hypothetical protein NIES4071_30470 [Calothrix sp. NIES-4071]|nr:hypothetical protein NIES4071_30470 [Calothrix sp. NIES-4071]BAZ57367.1 hypothetical protein NIES4105_30410 [Calothrix sp. NIES-4105]
MTRPHILEPNQIYTFSKYFELPYAPADILAELGCSFERTSLQLPKYSEEVDYLDFLNRYLRRNILVVNSISETAKREALIAPILLKVCDHTKNQLNIEYPINVSERLRGNFNYYVSASNNLLVVEAKQSDLSKGFTQLAVELIALDQWTNSQTALLYGTVTNGEDWRFGIFYRQDKRIVQDIKLYRVPEELEELVRVIVGILS